MWDWLHDCFAIRRRYAWTIGCIKDFLDSKEIGQFKDLLNNFTFVSFSLITRNKSELFSPFFLTLV
jgi:hypothetical protein